MATQIIDVAVKRCTCVFKSCLCVNCCPLYCLAESRLCEIAAVFAVNDHDVDAV